MENAASNANGSATGFMGIGMMNMMSGGAVTGAAQGPWNQDTTNSTVAGVAQNQTPATEETWECEDGHKNSASSKFCSECGKPRVTTKKCPKCGAENDPKSKFCNECGEKLD